MTKDKIDYLVMLIAEFAKFYKLTQQQAFNYIAKYKGLDLCENHYNIMHTLSLTDNIESLTNYCRRQGGNL